MTRIGVLALGAALGGLVALAWAFLLRPLPAGPSVPVGTDECSRGVCIARDSEALVVGPEEAPASGLVLYPGARVPPDAYLPLAALLARGGHLVAVPQLTLNLAVLEPNAARPLMARFSQVAAWAVGGHSLGGTVATRVAEEVGAAGLVLLASYPDAGTDLSRTDIRVLAVYGSEDALATPDEVREAAVRLPPDVELVEIEGGNHAQFGDYGTQRGDGVATITADEQLVRTAEAVDRFLAALTA